LGASGIQTGLKPKPVSSGPAPVNLYGSSNNDNDEGGGIASAFLGTDSSEGFFGGDDDGDGPLDDIGEAIGDLFEK
jgi:hypothetical protein